MTPELVMSDEKLKLHQNETQNDVSIKFSC